MEEGLGIGLGLPPPGFTGMQHTSRVPTPVMTQDFKPTTSSPNTVLMNPIDDLCTQFRVSPEAKAKLKQAGVTNAAILAMLKPGDLESLHLLLGQLRLLQNVQRVLQEEVQQSAAPPAGVEPSTVAARQNVLVGVEKPPVESENQHGAQQGGKVDLEKVATQATRPKLSRETLRRLRLGDTGEISYCKIKDYVTLKESEASEDEIVQMRDRWKLVNDKATPKIKLDNITVL